MEIMFQPGVAAIPATQVEISVSARNLVDMDVFSKSDPLCIIYTKQPGSSEWREYGRTEVIWNNLNPNFVKKFIMDYFFEESQKLRFAIYDVDSKSTDLSKHDFLGAMECTLAEIVTMACLKKQLVNNQRKRSDIIVTAEELTACKEKVTLQFQGRKLDRKDFFGKSDPFLLFYRTNENATTTVVHKTEAIKRTLNPNWKTFTIPVRALCNGDYDRSLRVECFDWEKDGGHDLIGVFSTTMRELSEGPGPSTVYEIINPKKQAKKGHKYKNSGVISLVACDVKASHTFLDYVRGGCQVHCTIAVDFTASNGDPRSATSLHYISQYQPNQYSMALRAVMEIIQDYDTDKQFPALGFGARLPPDGKTSHQFFLNGDPTNPFCQGVEGVMAAYHRTIQTVQLYGPTNFAPCINHVSTFAKQHQDGNNYFILLIITDGVITDMPQTTEAIVNASSLPLSIIIVGVGDADFEAMDTLDGDEVRLSSRGRTAERDIVQFVPFRDFLGRGGSSVTQAQARLAKEVLAEIPDQFLSYMETHGFSPKQVPLQRQATLPSAPAR